MAAVTETPPPPPWQQNMLRRRQDGGVTTRPPPAAEADRQHVRRRAASRYIDAFGEIVGLPSLRAREDSAPETAGSASCSGSGSDEEELQYGPGIVSRLRSRYMSMAQRDAAAGDAMRRAASLQDILRREGAFERGAVQDSYLLTGRATLATPAAWGESIRKAKSVGDLVSERRPVCPRGPPPPPPPAPSDSGAARRRVAVPSVASGDKMRATDGGPQVVIQPPLVRTDSKPAADTVSTVKRLFEAGTRQDAEAPRLAGKAPPRVANRLSPGPAVVTAAGGSGGGGGSSRDRPGVSGDAAAAEKGGSDAESRPAAADAGDAPAGDVVTGAEPVDTTSPPMAGTDVARESGGPPPLPAKRQIGVIRPTPKPETQDKLDKRKNVLNQVKNGQVRNGWPAGSVQTGGVPLRAKNMVDMLLNGSTPVNRDKTIMTAPVPKGGPLTKASLAAAAVKRSRPLPSVGQTRPSNSIQAVNTRLVSASAPSAPCDASPQGPRPSADDELSVPNGTEGAPASAPTAAPTPTIAWHQQTNNSTRYNFTGRDNVPDYIEDDGMDIHRRAKPKRDDAGYVMLPGFDPGQTSDDDLLPTPLTTESSPPSCPVTFTNAGIIINGRSSLLQRHRDSTRAVWFSEARPRVYRYPSEASLQPAAGPDDGGPDQRLAPGPRGADEQPPPGGDRQSPGLVTGDAAGRHSGDPSAQRPTSDPGRTGAGGMETALAPSDIYRVYRSRASRQPHLLTAPRGFFAPKNNKSFKRKSFPAPAIPTPVLSSYTPSQLAPEAASFELGVTRTTRPPPPSDPAPEPPSGPTRSEDIEVAWSTEASVDMLF